MAIRDDDDVTNVVGYLRKSTLGPLLDRMINERLRAIEGYEDLPQSMRQRIEENATALYCAGYLHAVQGRP